MNARQRSLVEAYREWARTIAGDYVTALGEDATSIAYLALCRAAIEFRPVAPGRSAGFAGYARRGIRSALWSAWKATQRRSYARPVGDPASEIAALDTDRATSIALAVRAIFARLSPRMRRVLARRRDSKEYRDAIEAARRVAIELGISEDLL